MSLEPNWKKLEALSDEVDALVSTGQWDKQAFDRIRPEAREAAGGDADLMEFLYMEAKQDWLTQTPSLATA